MLDRLRGLARRLRFYLARRRYERELDDEVAFHLAMRAADLEAAGESAEAAHRSARRRLGSGAALRDESREVWSLRWLDSLLRDLRFAVRGFRRAPGFTAVSLVTLAFGIGGTTAFFSLIYAVLLRPLPYPDPAALMNLELRAPTEAGSAGAAAGRLPWSYPMFRLMRSMVRGFDGVAGFNPSNVSLRGTERPLRVLAEEVSAEYFEILGARAALGRLFGRGEDSVARGSPVAVLSDQLWRSRFGAAPDIVGRQVWVSGTELTVIGVMSPRFVSLSGAVDLWVPLTMAPAFEYGGILEERWNHWILVVARVSAGRPLAAVSGELARVGAEVDRQYRAPDQTGAFSAAATPLADLRVDPAVRRASLVLFGAVGFVLLIGCSNVAGLLVARSARRRRELALRASLGAGRATIVRQLLTEAGLLGLLGGLAGVVVAWAMVRGFGTLQMAPTAAPGGLSYLLGLDNARLEWPVLGFGLAASLATGLLVGILPARQAARESMALGLRDAAPGSRPGAARSIMIGLETALAVVLVIGAGLTIRSFARLEGADRGFAGDHVLTFRIAPGDRDLAARRPVEFKARAIEALSALPGVRTVGVNTCTPLSNACSSSIVDRVDDRRMGEGGTLLPIGVHPVSRGYFEALAIPLLAGRWFDRTDVAGGPRVVIVNRRAAERLWPGQNPIGRRLAVATGYFHGGDSLATVVGVVADVRYGDAERPADLDVYLPALQRSGGWTVFLIRTEGNPLGIAEPARRVIQAEDPELPVFAVRTMDEITARSTARSRLAAFLLGGFAASALLLSAIGVWGVIAYAVASRRKEIGIRLAIGAEPGRVVGLMVRQGAVPVAIGIGSGLGLALGLTRVLRGMLFQVRPDDPLVFAGAVIVLLLVGLGACWLPARRAARVDAMVSLRTEG